MRQIGQLFKVFDELSGFFQKFVFENRSTDEGRDPEAGHQIRTIGNPRAPSLGTNPPHIPAVGKIAHLGQHCDKNIIIAQLGDSLYLHQFPTEKKHATVSGDPDAVVRGVGFKQFAAGNTVTEAIKVVIVGEELSNPFGLRVDEHIDAQYIMVAIGADVGIEYFTGQVALK